MRIISGGQTGVDIAGVRTAKLFKFATGGWMPAGWKTLDGPRPEYENLYNMQQHISSDYKPRTYRNVEESDLTIRIAKNFDSAGEKCTLNAIFYYKKPWFDINIQYPDRVITHLLDGITSYVWAGNTLTINIAGNSEKTVPGIEKTASTILMKFFDRIKNLHV